MFEFEKNMSSQAKKTGDEIVKKFTTNQYIKR